MLLPFWSDGPARLATITIPSDIKQTHVQRLFDAVYDPGFTYIVHVDIKSDGALIDGISAYVESHAGAHLIPPVRYGFESRSIRPIVRMGLDLEIGQSHDLLMLHAHTSTA